MDSVKYPQIPWGNLVDERNEQVDSPILPPLSVGKKGVTPQLDNITKAKDKSNRKIVREGDLVINSRSDRRGASGLSSLNGTVSVVYSVMTPRNEVLDPNFAHHLLRSSWFQEEFFRYGTGIVADLWSTRFERMCQIRVTLPELHVQRVIADYLDRETNEIDAMLDKLEGLGQLLASRRRNEINSAFTAPKLAPLWNFCDINPPTTDFKSLAEDTLVTFMPLETIWPDHRVDFSRTIKWSQKVGSYTEFQKEDVLIPKITPTFEAGRATVANIPLPIGLATTEVHIARTKTQKALPKWLAYAFQTTSFLKEGEATLQGVGNLRRITPQWLHQFKVPEFSLTEQARIVAHLNETTSQIDAMLAKVQELKDLLDERRSALITAAVTGQIEVN